MERVYQIAQEVDTARYSPGIFVDNLGAQFDSWNKGDATFLGSQTGFFKPRERVVITQRHHIKPRRCGIGHHLPWGGRPVRVGAVGV